MYTPGLSTMGRGKKEHGAPVIAPHSPLLPVCHHHTYHSPSSLEWARCHFTPGCSPPVLGSFVVWLLPHHVQPLSWPSLTGMFCHHDMGMYFMLNSVIAVFIITAYQWQGSVWYLVNALQPETTRNTPAVGFIACGSEDLDTSNQGEPGGISVGGC